MIDAEKMGCYGRLWMGSNPPLGHEVKDRQLEVSEAEAVCHIVRRSTKLGSIRAPREELLHTGTYPVHPRELEPVSVR